MHDISLNCRKGLGRMILDRKRNAHPVRSARVVDPPTNSTMGVFRRSGRESNTHLRENESMLRDEQVLVVERRIIEQVGMFQGLTLDVEPYLSSIFASGIPRFLPRRKAEDDPSYKQLIPYVIVAANGKYLNYVRGKQGGEKRLVGNRSIGIGGHINPVDDMPLFDQSSREAYLNAVEREVAEEVSLRGSHTDHIVALLNDDSTEVGRVHLGVVHFWSMSSDEVRKGEKMITQLGFMSEDELRGVRDELESWSQFCLDHLTDLAGRCAGRDSKQHASEHGVSFKSR